jgi:lysozyme family protein
MKDNFPAALKQVLVYEGNYVNNPNDPGGATNKGITQAVYNAWRKSRKQAVQSVKLISDAEVAAIYKQNYWNAIKGDSLASGLDLATFDYAVNSGVGRASKALQAAVGVAQDGIIGPQTIAAANKNPTATIANLCNARLAFLKGLKTWRFFGKGWNSRVASLKTIAIVMASQASGGNGAGTKTA